MKFLPNTPSGVDLFEGKPLERVSRALRRLLEDIRNKKQNDDDRQFIIAGNAVVGLEGGWGSGKSNVIKILEKDLGEIKGKPYRVVEFDLWGRQYDLSRKGIIEGIIEKLKERDIIKKDEFIDELKALTVDQTTKWADIPVDWVGWTEMLTWFLAPLSAVSIALAGLCEHGRVRTVLISVAVLLIVGALLVFFARFLISRERLKNSWKKLFGRFYLAVVKGGSSPITEVEYHREVATDRFVSFVENLSERLRGSGINLLVVFDNLDRLDNDAIRKFWASVHTLFAAHYLGRYANIHIIIPFDRDRVRATFKKNDGNVQDADDYINKVFDVVYRVPPPILKSWKNLLVTRLKEAFANEEIESAAIEQVLMIYDYASDAETRNPRRIISFVNEMAMMRSLFDDGKVSLPMVALFCLCRQRIIESGCVKNNVLRDGTFIQKSDYLKECYLSEDQNKVEMAALAYQVDMANAGRIYKLKVIEGALQHGDGKTLLEEVAHADFSEIFNEAITGVTSCEAATRALKELDSADLSEEVRRSYWDKLLTRCGNEFVQSCGSIQEIQEYHEFVLLNISHPLPLVKKILELRIDNPQRVPAEDIALFYSIEKALGRRSLSIKSVMRRRDVPAEEFVDLLRIAESDYDVFNWDCDAQSLDAFLAASNRALHDPVRFAPLVCLPKEYLQQLVKTRKSFESCTQYGNSNLEVHIAFFKLLSVLSSEKLVCSMSRRELSGVVAACKACSDEVLLMYAYWLQRIDGTDPISVEGAVVNDSKDEEVVKRFASALKRCFTLDELLLKVQEYRNRNLFCKAVKVLINEDSGWLNSLDKVSLLKNGNFLRFDYDVDFSRIVSLVGTDIIYAELDKIDSSEWARVICADGWYWMECAAVETDWVPGDALITAVAELVAGFANPKPTVRIPYEYSFGAIIDKFEKNRIGSGEYFRNLKDAYVKQGADILPTAFISIAPYLFRFCSFGEDENELRRLLPASVRNDPNCQTLILKHSDEISSMFAVSNDKDSFIKFLKDIGAEANDSEFNAMYKSMIEVRDKEDHD